MTLREFFEQYDATTRSLAEAAGVSRATVHNARRGMRISKYETARRISAATGGQVTVAELCERGGGR